MTKTRPIRTLLVLAAALSVLATACAADAPVTAAGPSSTEAETIPEITEGSSAASMPEEDHDAGMFWFGTPAEATDATRAIEIKAQDDFSFDPAAIDVEVGETVTFRVINVGNLQHDFTLGDAQMQDDHEAEMAEMAGSMMGEEDPNAFTIEAGETKDLTWTFTEEGSILMGCHIPGHYAAGMRGEIRVAAAG